MEQLTAKEQWVELDQYGYVSEYVKIKVVDGKREIFPAFPAEDLLVEKWPIKGTTVYYIGKNGYDFQRQAVEEHMKVSPGDPLTINKTYIGPSSSTYEFVEFPGVRCNTVMFSTSYERDI